MAKNGLWISLSYEKIGVPESELKKLNGKYVIIERVFDKNGKGHLAMNSGEIKEITRYQLWEKW